MPPPASSLHVALLAGGRGTRFWPVSRKDRPKQLVDVTGEGPLLLRTLERVAPLVFQQNVLAVTSADIERAVRAMLPLPRRNVLVEPSPRNTAAAVGLALLVASARDPDAIVLALPSDHHVAKPAKLRAALRNAAAAARKLRGLVLIGLEPSAPDPSFGYLVRGAASATRARRVTRFVEKPPAREAAKLIEKGALWNSGMFCLHAGAALEEIDTHLPALARSLERLRPHVDRATWSKALAREWPGVPAESFDRAVLEKSARVHAIEASGLGWSDVGSWEATARLAPPDRAGNRVRGPALLEGSSDCIVVGESSRTVVLLGASDLVVVDAGDAILVAPRSELSRLPELVARLERERPELT